MIKSDRNTYLDIRERNTQHMSQHSKDAHKFPISEHRNAVRKSKSVGYDAAVGVWVWSEMIRGNEEAANRNHSIGFSTDYRYRNNGIETRTVKSDTCLSPTKHRTFDLGKQSEHCHSKKSPSSVIQRDKQHSLQRAVSDKRSLSNHSNSVLEILSGYSTSANFNLSSCFSNDDDSEGSSFAGDDILSLPTTIRLSVGNASIPSEFTVSQSLETCSPQSKPEDRSKLTVTHNISQMSIDVRPRPPRRKQSDKQFTVASLSKSLVPKQIQCFPMDESPTKPSRQLSVSKLQDGSSSSLVTKVSSIDLSPKKPKRYNSEKSFDSESSCNVQSGISIDSSPHQPQRQESIVSLASNAVCDACITKPKNRSNTPIRKVYRSESQLQPMLPILSRRTGIRGKTNDLSNDDDIPSAVKQPNLEIKL